MDLKTMIAIEYNGNIFSLLEFLFFLFICGCSISPNVETEDNIVGNRDTDITEPFGQVDAERPMIVLSTSSLNSERKLLTVDYNKSGKGDSGPRVAELFLEYPSNLQYITFQKGDAVTNAEKQLIVQDLPNESRLRMVILASDNTNELETGRLATLTFKKTNDKEATVRILTDRPIFAPEAANEGLLVSDPITF